MDFRLDHEDEVFRKEVRHFLDRELPSDWLGMSVSWAGYGASSGELEGEARSSFYKKLVERGWPTMAWPKEYGGQGASYTHQYVYNDEMSYRGAPGSGGMAVTHIGPAIMVHGSEEHKKKFLGGISRGEITFAQGFSEPGAGSDLAAVTTKAVRDGDDWVINGQKTFTTGAHHADYIWLLARTNPNVPKHKGLSMFIFPMNTAGITARPYPNICDILSFNDVYLDNVRVPKDALVGEENQGWYQAMTGLDFERSGVARFAGCRRALELLVRYMKETRWNGSYLSEDPRHRDQLAELAVEVEIGRLMALRIIWMQTNRMPVSNASSVSKLFGSELAQRLSRIGGDIMGPFGTLRKDSKWAPLRGFFEIAYRNSVSATLGAGTSEVQRNILAQRGLGLPR
ncbi:MAG: acyl-CoA dehydrogenase family protein [Chloroflexi bacterium]|nr:acyl-CoA dehydrogenase family protein [Chloroflexota bacterium]